ncbi:hypothetical protein NEF87_005019 [Candidatus Lokiarchaeum ossiferum]|uniref:L-seryl-tRNA(Sec) kinase n=1 Tax=Candidatus Lokiarchaeum ossiferum TaxID=2951803 RepID=A0ABY6I233_9ARCH|nr:hypothetical protein NEF87_005019 [Candidatus Lokiarchaeum sp. B-35]
MNEITKPKYTTRPILILLMGLPASGKSTFAQLLQEVCNFESMFDSVTIIDIDEIRTEMFGPIFQPEKENEVQAEKFKRVHQNLKSNSVVIVDDLHYFISMRHRYFEMSINENAIYIPIYFSNPEKVCLKWNFGRGSPIPSKLIHEIKVKFDFPGQKYKWDAPKLEIDFSRISLDGAIEKTLNQVRIEIENNKRKEEESKQMSLNQNSKESQVDESKNETEKLSRSLIHDIITEKISQSNKEDINRLLLKEYDIPLSSIEAPKILSELRKKFLIWKEQKEYEKISMNLFLEFLNESLSN